VKTGCISCTSGDGQNGGPIWWNTPITEEIQTKVMKKKAAAKAQKEARRESRKSKVKKHVKKKACKGHKKV